MVFLIVFFLLICINLSRGEYWGRKLFIRKMVLFVRERGSESRWEINERERYILCSGRLFRECYFLFGLLVIKY